jgi:hypothetical protein
VADPLGRRAFLGLGAALAAVPFSRTAGAAALSAADRANVAAVLAMAETWKSVDVAKRNTLFTPDAIFRGAAERIEASTSRTTVTCGLPARRSKSRRWSASRKRRTL